MEERYVVIKDGVVNLFKSRDDLAPTHRLPLNNLLSLRDASHVLPIVNNRNTRSSDDPTVNGGTGTGTGTGTGGPPSPAATATGRDRDKDKDRDRDGAQRKRRSTSLPRMGLPPLKIQTRRKRTRTSSDARSSLFLLLKIQLQRHPKSGSGSRTDVDERSRASSSTRTRTRTWKEKEKEKEKGKGKEKEKGKGKEGEKEKGKAKEKEKEREVGETSSSKGKEREREDREHRDRERQRQREKEKAQRDERTFIPASKEEAEAAGMKIVCAKFRHLRPWDKEYLDRELASLVNPAARMAAAAAAAAGAGATASSNTLGTPGGAVASSAVSALSGSSSALSGGSTPRYTSTGPSLAGSTVTDGPSPGSGERLKHSRNITNNSSNHPYQQSTSAISAISGPPRKSSFPTLVGLLGSSASTSASASASAAGSSLTLAPSSVLVLHSVTSGSSSMGAAGGAAASPIVSLFGKDKDKDKAGDGSATTDKEERKREEKERKAREKEQKALEKEKKKAAKRKEREETGDEDDGLRLIPKREVVRESMDTQATVTASLSSPQPIAAAPSNRAQAALSEDQQQDKPHDPHPPIPPNRPKLTLSPVKDPSASTSASAPPTDQVSIPKDPETTNVNEDDAEVDPEQHSPGHHSDSGSSSRSLSSPSGEDFDDEFGIGVSGYRRDRMGYRYGGKLEKEKEAGRVAGSAAAGVAPALPAPASALTPADQDVRGVQSRVGGAEKGPARRDVSQTRSTQSQPQRRLRKREDERGEWIVLDMGNEQAYNSMLRVLHRCFAQPLTSTFVNPSIGDRQPASSCTAPPAQTRSPLNSPTQSTFWSTTTLVGGTGSDARSVVSERTKSLRTVDSFSSIHGRPSTTSSDTDDESVHANPAQAPNNQAQDPSSVLVGTSTQSRAEHPPILQTSSKPPKRGALAPALHYPEWRLEIVRQAGRPLDLALNGLNAEMDERDIRARMKVWEERERRRRELEEQEAQRMDEMRMRELQERVGGEEDAEEGDDDEEEEEEEESSEDESDDGDSGDDEQQPTGFDEEQRRMSAISHVSTLNAMQMNAAAAAAIANRPSAATNDQTFVLDEGDDHDAPGPSAAHVEDELAARYSFQYGHEDEEDAIALDSDEESETEWLAWVTDLPRQRAEREKERKRLEQERQQRQLEVPLSPMDHPSQLPSSHNGSETNLVVHVERSLSESRMSFNGSIRSGQAEERRQVVESRRMMEPTATSTFIRISTPPPPPSVLPVPQPTSAAASGVGLQNLLSQASTSSISAGPNVPPISINLGSFSPESDATDGYRDAPSSSTTPPSAGVHYQAKLIRAKTHSRAPLSRLHHSTSMPFAAAPAAAPSALAVSGGSSPMRSVSASISNSTTTGRAQHPIQQIEAETDLMIKQNSTRMSSSPAPSSYTSHTHVSAGTGASVPGGFASGSSPSRTMPGSSSESRMGASMLVKPHAPERRGVLRKRLSDLGKQISGDEKDGSPTSKSKKPKLSLAGLGGGGSSSHSQANNQPQQGLRSPSISNASSSAGSGSSGTMASAKALLRRVRSGSSLRMDMHTEEHESPVGSNHPVPNSPTSAAFSSSGGSNVMMTENASRGGSWGRETSPEHSRKRKGPVERLVQGLDSALEFRDGR
ncbi:hypothetical protein CPB84DRAFT_1786008 [Gymnopilus junonius]|uniref:Uncharacterized protein n=1 Tax=Gymnopilus junonius TaxID=109634 RepID=A0A9P5NJF2_GYMJU|nr:hypothetical protein CPB84DRAFT_1786008 [Gymnopilus junonius]